MLRRRKAIETVSGSVRARSVSPAQAFHSRMEGKLAEDAKGGGARWDGALALAAQEELCVSTLHPCRIHSLALLS